MKTIECRHMKPGGMCANREILRKGSGGGCLPCLCDDARAAISLGLMVVPLGELLACRIKKPVRKPKRELTG